MCKVSLGYLQWLLRFYGVLTDPPGPLTVKIPGPNKVKKQNQSLFPLIFSSGASLMQSNLDVNFLWEIVTSDKLFWITWKTDGLKKCPCQIGLKPLRF